MEVGQDCAAEDIAERASHRNRGAKERENSSPRLERKKVGQDSWRRRAVAAFANADQHTRCKKHGETDGQA